MTSKIILRNRIMKMYESIFHMTATYKEDTEFEKKLNAILEITKDE